MWEPTQNGSELYHYGVIGMRWGVHRARAAFRGGNIAKANKIKGKIVAKTTKKLNKINAKYEKKQARADRLYDKADRKANSLFVTKRSTDRAFRKAAKAQFKANKLAGKGKRWYEQMNKSYKKANIEMAESSRKIGEEFIRTVKANSRAMYAAQYAGG